jgi:hypothetical protein
MVKRVVVCLGRKGTYLYKKYSAGRHASGTKEATDNQFSLHQHWSSEAIIWILSHLACTKSVAKDQGAMSLSFV